MDPFREKVPVPKSEQPETVFRIKMDVAREDRDPSAFLGGLIDHIDHHMGSDTDAVMHLINQLGTEIEVENRTLFEKTRVSNAPDRALLPDQASMLAMTSMGEHMQTIVDEANEGHHNWGWVSRRLQELKKSIDEAATRRLRNGMGKAANDN